MGTYTHAHPEVASLPHRPYGAGALAGLIAGIVMTIVSMIVAATTGAGASMPLRGIAAALYGVDALVGGRGILLVGLMIHLAVSVVAGLVFAGIVGNVRTGVSFGAGIVRSMGWTFIPSSAIGVLKSFGSPTATMVRFWGRKYSFETRKTSALVTAAIAF